MEINQEIESEAPETPVSSNAEEIATLADADSDSQQKRRGVRKGLVIAVILLGLIAAAVWLAIERAQQIPDFYAQVLEIDEASAKIAGQKFERNLIRLQNVSRQVRPWKVQFTQEQLNGWMSSDLPEKFPEAIPRAITNPRVVFGDDEIKMGFKYDFRGATGYVVFDAEVFNTNVPNEIAIRISNVKTGFVPLPVGPWLEKVADSIREAGIPVFWSRNSGTPVAVFTLPEFVTSVTRNEVIVESIELNSEFLTIAGKTLRQSVPESEEESKPGDSNQAEREKS